MHHLVEQILDLNRTNPEIIKANFRELDLHALAQRVTAAAWPAFSAKEQNLSLIGEQVLMYGDEVMLETLLQNLLTNANKYTPVGGEISVSVTVEAGGAQLVVKDSGPGILPEEQSLVFDRFYRADSHGRAAVSGSGLGLAIVQHIVQLHNAQIALDASYEGTGLTVTVSFDSEHSGARS
jgi:two-component system sensor histidine kinase QseC